MDGYSRYQQPANARWLRLLFLTTGFIIASMCLWAFVQKQTERGDLPLAEAPPAEGDSSARREAAEVQQLSFEEPRGPWPVESPAREAIESNHRVQTAASWNDEAIWGGTAAGAMRRASYEPEAPSPVHVSKPPLDSAGPTFPLPDLIPSPADASQWAAQPITAERLSPAGPPPAPLGLPLEQPPSANRIPALQPAPVRPESIITRANDSFWNIAQRVYGDPRYYAALFEYNRSWIAYPDRLEPGFQVMTPPEEKLRELFPQLCADIGRGRWHGEPGP